MPGFEDVNHYVRQAARIMDLSPHVERMLVTPFREVKVDVSITLDTWEEERITTELGRHMREAYATLARVVCERKVSFRTAAFMVAIGRVGRATALRGV